MTYAGKFFAFALTFTLALPAFADPPSPTDYVRGRADELINIVNREVQLGTDEFRIRQDDIKSVVRRFLDYRTLCERALGRHWGDRTEQEQNDFVELMTRLIETNYAVKLGDRSLDSEYEVVYEDERIRNDAAMVAGTVDYEGEVTFVEIWMLQRDIVNEDGSITETWIIHDVVTDDVSIEETYAESFDEIILDEGWDALVERLEDRVAELEEELEAQLRGEQ